MLTKTVLLVYCWCSVNKCFKSARCFGPIHIACINRQLPRIRGTTCISAFSLAEHLERLIDPIAEAYPIGVAFARQENNVTKRSAG
jgi:hypothetical protein